MSEREEIQLRRLESTWQSRQNLAGNITLFSGFITLGACLAFLSAPGWQLAGVMACLMVLLVLSCWRLLSSAARVVEIRKRLSPSRRGSRFKSEIVEAEVVDPIEQRVLLA